MHTSQIEFVCSGGATSQTNKLITALMEANGGWVEMPALCDITGSLNIHSRCADARKKGYNIENKTTLNPITGKRESFYRVVP